MFMETIFTLRWDDDSIVTAQLETDMHGKRLVALRDSSVSFRKCRSTKPIPLEGRHFYELIVDFPEPGASNVCALGIANRGFPASTGPGWSDENEGIGCYSSGLLYRNAQGCGSIDSYENGDTIGVLVDRQAHRVYYFINGRRQSTYVEDKRLEGGERYIACIMCREAKVTLKSHRTDVSNDMPTT